jgi:hypothetical protein
MKYLSTITSLDYYKTLYKFMKELNELDLIKIFDNNNLIFQQNIFKALLNIKISTNDHIIFIEKLIKLEVQKSSNPSTLFRANSIASKVLTFFMLKYGQKYLYEIFNDKIIKICYDENYLEVDPTRVTIENYDFESSMKDLLFISQSFFNTIVDSLGKKIFF